MTKYFLPTLMTLSIVLSMGLAALGTSNIALAQPASGDRFGLEDADFGDTLQGGNNLDLRDTITEIMQWLFSFLGILAVLIILWGGFMWMTAGGSDDKVKKAKNILIRGVIGLIIILTSYAIATFVFREIEDNLLQ